MNKETFESINKKTKRVSSDFDGVQMENARGEWVPAIPLPFYGLKKRCTCDKSFWFYENYLAHYALKHIVLGDLPL